MPLEVRSMSQMLGLAYRTIIGKMFADADMLVFVLKRCVKLHTFLLVRIIMNVDFDVVVRENLLRPWLVRKVKRHDSLDEEAYGDRNGTFLEAHLLNLIKSY